MAKITRSKLARGAKLLVEHIFTPLTAAKTAVESGGIEQSQMREGFAPFRVNLSVPNLNPYKMGTQTVDLKGQIHGIPFIVPPLQDELTVDVSSTGNVGTSSPSEVILDEVSFSFDTRAEPAAIVSHWEHYTDAFPSPDQGKLSYDNLNVCDVDLAILEKRPTWGQANPTTFTPSRVVWEARINASLDLSASTLRLGNPITVANIGRSIDPFKSYIFTISFPKQSDGLGGWISGNTVFEMVSAEISMRFLSPLRERDFAPNGTEVQNIPTRHKGMINQNQASQGVTGAGEYSSTSRSTTITAPSAGDSVTANTDATGIQTAMAVIDEFFRAKLRGGYTMRSDVPQREQRRSTAAYSVIAVPMFGNTRFGGIALDETRSSGPTTVRPAVGGEPEPYVITNTNTLLDRRIIPIRAPMTIHHVVAVYPWLLYNQAVGTTLTQIKKSPDGAAGQQLYMQIGVGMGTGHMADMFGYEEIAKKTLNTPTAATWYGDAFDLIMLGDFASLPSIGESPTAKKSWNLEVHPIPLVGSGGKGLSSSHQGKPIFVGKSDSRTSARTQIDGADSKVHGAEQWIEVRVRLGASEVGADWDDWVASSGSHPRAGSNAMIMGSGGMWVYIIGKTHTV